MATDPSELIHVTTRPLSTPPFASCNVAKSCTVPPTCRLEDAGLTMTDATGAGGGGGSAVTVAVPFLPSLVTVIAAVPAATPVTSPLPFTMATDTSLLYQVTGVFHAKSVPTSPFQITSNPSVPSIHHLNTPFAWPVSLSCSSTSQRCHDPTVMSLLWVTFWSASRGGPDPCCLNCTFHALASP